MIRTFAVIGHPISHSLSPAMHNAVFQELGIEGHYTLFDVDPGDLSAAINGMKALGFGGCNVTIPHKVDVIKYLDELSEEARVIGAVNTIEFGKRTKGHNTDGIGALEALKGHGTDPREKNVLVIGSGGAARAISVTLALRGGVKGLTIMGINKPELQRLGKDITTSSALTPTLRPLVTSELDQALLHADIVVHATPVGMHPKIGETLIKADQLKPDLAIMDIVYNPLETQLMKEARKAGVKEIIGGVDMFVNQGAEALRIWLGIEPPIEIMKRAVMKGLSYQKSG